MGRRKLLLLEINEITWDLLDPFIEKGLLPAFAKLKREGAWASPLSVDQRPYLDPWITWTTVYSGRPQADHKVEFLQQPPESIKAKRIWDICNESGLRVGVYGSLCSWPPKKMNGYYVPDTFAPDTATYPESLRPIQQLNLTYTRSVRLPSDEDGLMFKARLGSKLFSLGLTPATSMRIAKQLVRERINPEVRWQRVALQPFVNFDFFKQLYRQHQPEYASFHTNHVAHYQHTYWKPMAPGLFPQETTPEEIRIYSRAIEYGYRTADELLQRVLNIIGRDTVLVVASSMGQKPFISDLKKGKAVNQLYSLDKMLEILGVKDRAKALPVMSDQFNIYADSPDTRDHVAQALRAAYIDNPKQPMFTSLDIVDNSVSASLMRYDTLTEESRCYFPHREKDNAYKYDELVYTSGMVKSGWHDPKGMMILYGPGIRSGVHIEESNNLDLAPTFLHLLGLPIPSEMKGRVLEQALTETPAAAVVHAC